MLRKFKLNNKEISFKIYNPGGNKTGLVLDNNYSKSEYLEINNYILENYPDIEQVGFISKENNRLNMAGGEFCVNASRSAIYNFLDGKDGEIYISVSGNDELIYGGIFNGKVFVKMPFKNVFRKIQLTLQQNNLNAYMVILDGIEHIVIDYSSSEKYINYSADKLKKISKEIMQQADSNSQALGVIFLERINNSTKIYPVVWVKSIDTLYFETACGSGTITAFTYLYNLNNLENVSILQPSGFYLDVKKEENYIVLSGIVAEE